MLFRLHHGRCRRNTQLRKLFSHGARTVLHLVKDRSTPLASWACGLKVRIHVNVGAVALAMRGNNDRMFLAKREVDIEADNRLMEVLDDRIDVPKFTIAELVFRCKIGPRLSDDGRSFDAILRAIADEKLSANRRQLIHDPSVVDRAA